jgi:hypothetical protein
VIYINIYYYVLEQHEDQSNAVFEQHEEQQRAVDKSVSAVITRITYTIYMNLQKYIYYRREEPSVFPILPNLPTHETSRPPQIIWNPKPA